MKSMCKTLIGRIGKFASLHPKKKERTMVRSFFLG